MGLWANTFGGGNSFKESVANTFTKDDGATYVKGTLTNDKTGQAVKQNETGGFGTVDAQGKSQYSGDANSTTTVAKMGTDGIIEGFKFKGQAPDKFGLGDAALAVVNPITILPKVFSSFASWANGIDPEVDASSAKNDDGQMVYTKKDGSMSYSYNAAKMPYEVKVVGGKVVDKLSMMHNEKGELDTKGTITGYQYHNNKNSSTGDNDGNSQIAQYEANNAAPQAASGGAGGSGNNDIMAMAEKAGLLKVQADMDAILADPNKFLADRGLKLADLMTQVDGDATGTSLNPDDPNYKIGDESGYTPVTAGDASTVDPAVQTETATYDSEMNEITNEETVNAVTGTVSDEALVDADKFAIDITGSATGINADGTKNDLGIALNTWANVDISKVIDTSTAAGKLLADKLNSEGKDFVDAKTSILFQMKTITEEFKGPNNEPVIPPWAASLHRNSMKSIAFSGISGTAATAAMANAIMEATLGVAEKEASFFQSLTVKNLDNKQESIINKANVLSKLEMANLDVRSQAAVQNAKAFMTMDLQNMTNEQQAEVINKEALVQAMFNNTNEINANRLFTAESENDRDTFYAELNANIQKHNTSEQNILRKFNAGEINGAAEFNATMRDAREQFVANMQYNIDISNAKWRRSVETQNTVMMADAHAADVKAALDLTQEVQNNIWDSADNLLDYIWKTADNDQERELRLLMAQMTAQTASSSGGNGIMDGLLNLAGAYVGSTSGSGWMTSLLGGKA